MATRHGGSRRQVAATRERILEASLDLFAELGFEGTGISDIASRVGIAKSVIYHHFRNKDAILDEIARETIGATIELKRVLADRFAGGLGAEAGLERMAEAILDLVLARRKAIRLLLMESIKGTRRVPLLDFWDANLAVGAEVGGRLGLDLAGKPAREALFEAFFMLVLPVVGYAVLEEKWAKRYEERPARMRELFAKVMSLNMQELWQGRLVPGATRRSE